MANGPILRKYGASATINFELFEVDGVDFRVDAAHAAGDTVIMKDEGAEANTTNSFTDEGNGYSLVLTATEMQAARVVIYVVDQTATKVWLDSAIIIETYGNASAQHAVDLDDSVRAGLTALPNAAADAAGGLPISDAGGLDMDSIKTDTAEIGTAGAGLTDLGGMSTGMKSEVNAECDTALSDYDGPTNAEMEARTLVAASYFDPAADTVANVTNVATTTDLTNQKGVSSSGTAQSVTATTIQLAASETFATSDIIGATVEIESATTGIGQSRLITAYDGTTDTATVDAWNTTPTGTIVYNLFVTPPSSASNPADVSVAQILGEPLNESTPGRIANNFDIFYDNSDSQTTKTVDDVGVAGSGLTQQNVRDAMKLTPTAGAPSADSVDEHLDDILTDTGTDIPASISGLNDFDPALDTVANVTTVATTTTNTDMRGTDSAATSAQVASLNDFDPSSDVVASVTLVDTTTTNTDMRGTDGANTTAPDNAGIAQNGSDIAALNDLSAAEVNAEMVDVLTVDTYAEPSGVPAATSSLKDKIAWLFTLGRNKTTQTATTQTIRNDADSGDIATSTVSDDGTTTTRNEYS